MSVSQYARDYQRQYYLRRKRRGCIKCGKPKLTRSCARCDSCAKIHAAQAKEYYERSKLA
jgi:hypothetical protein